MVKRTTKRKGINAETLLQTMFIRLAQTSELSFDDFIEGIELVVYNKQFSEDYTKVFDNSKLIKSYNVQVW